jgi:hypothetical protein
MSVRTTQAFGTEPVLSADQTLTSDRYRRFSSRQAGAADGGAQASLRRRLLRRALFRLPARRPWRALSCRMRCRSTSTIRLVRASMSARVGRSSRSSTPRMRVPISRSMPPRMPAADPPPATFRAPARDRDRVRGLSGWPAFSNSSAASRSSSLSLSRSVSSACTVVRLYLAFGTDHPSAPQGDAPFVTARRAPSASASRSKNPVLLRLKLLGPPGIVPL